MKELFLTLTPGTKKKLICILAKKGMCETSVRTRFASARFREWEIKGLRAMIREYNPKYRGSFADFWDKLLVKEDFYQFMRSKGMSRHTVLNKFGYGTAKAWELEGIESIIVKAGIHEKANQENALH